MSFHWHYSFRLVSQQNDIPFIIVNCRNRPNIWQKIESPLKKIFVVYIWKTSLKLDNCAFIISFRRFSNANSTAENTYHDRVWLFLAVFVCSSTQLCMSTGVESSFCCTRNKIQLSFKLFHSMTGRARSLWHHWQRV